MNEHRLTIALLVCLTVFGAVFAVTLLSEKSGLVTLPNPAPEESPVVLPEAE